MGKGPFEMMERNYISGVRLKSPVDEGSYLHGLPVVRHLAHVHQLVGQNSQFIIATHSPILITYPGAEVLEYVLLYPKDKAFVHTMTAILREG